MEYDCKVYFTYITSRATSDFLNEQRDEMGLKSQSRTTNEVYVITFLDEKKDPSSIEKKTKKGQKKAKPSKKQNKSQSKNFEQDNKSIEKPLEDELNLNQIVDIEKKKSTKTKSRKMQSSAKIDVVNLNSEKNKIKTKKTGWWNN